MTQEQIEQIEKVVQAYKNRKEELKKRIQEIEKLRAENIIYEWSKQEQIDSLYDEIATSKERTEFHELALKANSDSDFENYFRAAHLKSFFGIDNNL